MQTKKLLKLLLLKLYVLLEIAAGTGVAMFMAYQLGFNLWLGAIVGVIGTVAMIFNDPREYRSKAVLTFPASTYLERQRRQPPRE